MKGLLHRFGQRITAMAVLALLLAQMGAMSHAYSHDATVGSSASHRTGASTHDPCGDCLAFASVLSAAGGPGAVPFIAPHGRSPATSAPARSLVDLSLTLAFRSRAPPYTP
ncbi:MAG: hypothetical protein JWN43_447 [Gammaproteobacteria bacterium]|nr:hypothetical protein [Gammaproteobacteria bacterium]